jgi:hypothetical protein
MHTNYSTLFASALPLLVSGCGLFDSTPSTSADPRYALISRVVSDQNATLFRAYPNDPAVGDSLLSHIGDGFLLTLQPGGQYQWLLTGSIPDTGLELNLFQLEGDRINTAPQILSGECSDTTCLFDLTPPVGAPMAWQIAALSLPDGSAWTQQARQFAMTGQGSHPLVLDLNFIFLGKLTGYETAEQQQRLADFIATTMTSIYGASGVTVGTVRRVTGSTHPSTELRLPDTETYLFDPGADAWRLLWQSGGQALNLDLLSYGWPTAADAALEIAVVEQIDIPGFIGIAPLQGYSLKAGPGGGAVIGVTTRDYYGNSLDNDSSLLAETLIHEVGHFFGLRHTTATATDMEAMGDYSLVEDGMSDTPFSRSCPEGVSASAGSNLRNIAMSPFRSLFDPAGRLWEARVLSFLAATDLLSCPDLENLMFPTAVDGVHQTSLTAQQNALLAANLALIPH